MTAQKLSHNPLTLRHPHEALWCHNVERHDSRLRLHPEAAVTQRRRVAAARLRTQMLFHCWALLVCGLVLLQTGCGGTAQSTSPQVALSITTVAPFPTVNGPAFTMNVYGTGFVPGAGVFMQGSSLTSASLATTFIDSTHLTAAVPADAFTAPASGQIFVSQPAPPSCNNQYCGLGVFSNFVNFGVQ